MSSTYNDVRAAIEGRIATEMGLSPSYPVAYQNVSFNPPNNSPWVQVRVSFGDNNYATLQSPSTGFNKQNGVLFIDIFTPRGVGPSANLTVGERLKDKFDRAKFSSIIFDAASGPSEVTPAAPEDYFQTELTISFSAYLD